MRINLIIAGMISICTMLVATGGTPTESDNEKQFKPQTTCPVMGRIVNRGVFADYNDKRIYFACVGARTTFNNDPEFYLGKMLEKGEFPIDIPHPEAQNACPVDGGKIDSSQYVDCNGERLYACSRECREKIGKKPGKYRRKIIASGQWPNTLELRCEKRDSE